MKKMTAGIIGILLMITGCTNRDTTIDRGKLLGNDYRLFQNTPAWELAKAVEDEDIDKIKEEVSKNKSLLSYREPRFGQPILMMAVMNKNYNSVKTLAELGADPNMQDNYEGSSPLMEAARIGGGGFVHTDDDPRYLELLIKHGGDVNEEEKGPRKQGNAVRETPLLIACDEGNLQYAKILVNAGANVNYVNEYGSNTLYGAIVAENPDLVLYLLEKGADFKRPMYKTIDKEDIFI
jgi:hypothetical protein